MIINDFIVEMAKLNFKNRLPEDNQEDTFSYMKATLNALCEELDSNIVRRHKDALQFINEGVIITNDKGVINIANRSA